MDIDSNDGINGTDEAEFVQGLIGDDCLFGRDVNDFIDGNQGSDYLNGNFGDDNAQGGSGSDDLRGGASRDVFTSKGGDDRRRNRSFS